MIFFALVLFNATLLFADPTHFFEGKWYDSCDEYEYQYCNGKRDTCEIRHKFPNGEEFVSEYDENGKIIHVVYPDGELWSQYDDKGNEIYVKEVYKESVTQYWKEYDSKGNLIHGRKSGGYEWWVDYDERDNETYERDSEGERKFVKLEYDEKGRVTHTKITYSNSDEVQEWWDKYDDKGNRILTKEQKGERKFEYDKKNRLIKEIDFAGEETRYKWFEKKTKKGFILYQCLNLKDGRD